MGNTLPYSFVFLAVVLTARTLAGGPAVPIQSIFLSVFRPALLQWLEFHLWDNTEAAKREYNGPNRDGWLSLLGPLVADGAPHGRRPDAPGKSDLLEHCIQPITQSDDLLPRHVRFPFAPERLDHL
jgi:hypothetical protein